MVETIEKWCKDTRKMVIDQERDRIRKQVKVLRDFARLESETEPPSLMGKPQAEAYQKVLNLLEGNDD